MKFTADKIILGVSILFGLFLLINLPKDVTFLSHAAQDSSNIDFSFFLFLFLFILPLIAIYLFWKRKKIGWILLAIIFTYSIVAGIIRFIFMIKLGAYSEMIWLNLIAISSPIFFIGAILFYGCCLWLICKNNLRKVYAIDNQTMKYTIGIAAILVLVVSYLVIY